MGFPFAKFFSVLTFIGPMILMAVPGGAGLAPLIPIIITGIAEAQKKPGATGAEKKAYVLSLVDTAIAGINAVRPGTVNASQMHQAAGYAIDAIITSMHAVEAAHEALPHIPSIAATP